MTLREQFVKEQGNNLDWENDKVVFRADYVEWLESRVPQWISVTDRLPDINNIEILMGDISWPGWKEIGYYDNGKFYYKDGDEVIVTHWMLLSEIPKEE